MMPSVPSVQPPAPRRRDDSGQVAVEGAIVLPAMTFLVLMVMQLTMVQHARIMTEYAAFCAARAGIVYNADNTAMTRAATVALIPTIGRADSMNAYTGTAVSGIARENNQRAPVGLPIVEVQTLSPKASDVTGAIARHLNGLEVDFDDIRPEVAQFNILQIRVRYYYRMSIPFANQMLQSVFMAQMGHVFQPGTRGHTDVNMLAPDVGSDFHHGARSAFAGAASGLIPRAGAIAAAAEQRHYYFPLQATYSMRMQSNVFPSNLQ